MHRFRVYIAGIFIFIVSCKKDSDTGTTTVPPTEPPLDDCTVQLAPGNGSVINGRYIVAFNDAANARTMSAPDLARYSNSVLAKNNIRSSALLHSFGGNPAGFIANLNIDEVSRLRSDGTIRMIEPDRVIALGDCFTVVAPSLVTWNVDKVGYGDGTGKTAWIMDTGIDFTHPDLNTDSTKSKSFLEGIISARDENGHGTHVAGIIGAKNNNIGTLGVASGATLISLRVLGKDGTGTAGAVIQALAYVSLNGKAGDVVNLSTGGDSTSNILDLQVQNTAAKGIFISMAAGNEKKPASSFSPGRVNGTNIYTVSAVDSLDNFADFSNYGNDAIDYAAPGVRIVSTWMGGQYARASGTSMAAPHLSGLLLLVGKNLKTQGTAINDPDGTPDPIVHK